MDKLFEIKEDGQYVYVTCKGLEVAIKADDEGLVVDIWHHANSDESIATTCAFYDEG